MTHDERYKVCFQAIEKELERRDLDYTIHGLPGADDIIHFEEYWLLTPERTKLFPAILDADEAKDLDSMIVRALQAHTALDETRDYIVVLCGEGWSADRIDALRRQVEVRLMIDIRLTIESLESFASDSRVVATAA